MSNSTFMRMSQQRRQWTPNPSKRFHRTDDRMAKKIAFESPSYTYRKNLTKIGGIDGMSMDFGVCWQCWIRITGQGINNWRKEPFSENRQHEETCPLCGYEHWQGRVWYPKRFIIACEIGNPSRRDSAMEGKT